MYVTQQSFSVRGSPLRKNSPREIFDEPDMRNNDQKFEYPNQWAEAQKLKRIKDSKDVKPYIQNKKYLEIVQLFIEKEHIWKLLKWINVLEPHQAKVSFPQFFSFFQSLRLLNTIYELKGKKKFRTLQEKE